MADTLTVLGLDSVDYRLAREWECENLLLDEHGRIETFAYGESAPSTLEVWPSVATGLPPEEHGIVSTSGAQDWEHPILRVGSSVTRHFPGSIRNRLGKPFHEAGLKKTFATTDADHVFTGGYVSGWPGITTAENLGEAWNLMRRTSLEETGTAEFEGELLENTGAELAWATRMSRTDAPIVGVHSHALDIAGHVYCRQKEPLREMYEFVDSLVGWVRSEVDRLVVVSDHGTQTTWTDDDEPGRHSMRSMIGTTEEGPLPESVFDVREWLEARMGAGKVRDEHVDSDAPIEHLRDMGYFQ